MQTKTNLKIDWASHEAVKFACENWHYSKCLPAGSLVKVGIWEDEKFIGCVIFSRGATPNLGKPYGMTQLECCELTRIAIKNHKTPVSKIMMICIKFFKKRNPGIKLIVSFADPSQGHHGGVYQATNWIYTGKTPPAKFGLLNGKIIHPRTIQTMSLEKRKKLSYVLKEGKYRYLFPLDESTRKLVEVLRIKYPKRVEHESNAVSFHETEGGAVPTDALHIEVLYGQA